MTADPHLLIIEARFYEDISDLLLAGAAQVCQAAGVTHDLITVPGSLEIPAAIAMASHSGQYHGYVALGCVIRGETSHYDIVAGESARGLVELGLRGLAIGNGILTVENQAQAMVRADPTKDNKGGMAVEACVSLIHLKRRFL